MPTRKINASALAGALSVILVWVMDTYTGAKIPPEIASAITTVLSFVTGYLVPEP